MERFFTLESLNAVPYYHLCIEIFLVYCIYRLYYTRPQRANSREKLTDCEKQKLIDEWEPEALYEDSPDIKDRVVTQLPNSRIIVDGDSCLDFGSFNFLGLAHDEGVKEAGKGGIRDYGVGSCGPRGFFGTFDAHLNLEVEIADFLRVDEAILYSYGFSTVASAIPAYSKRGDILFIDEQANFAIQQGAKASRSIIRWFRHNDIDHLTTLLDQQSVEDAKNPKKAKVTKKILVVEGIYLNTGTIAPIKKMIELKYKHKVRIFMDESNSFGVLGENGRGLTEHAGVDILDIDMIMAETEKAIPSIGGFCAGSAYVVDHQRLAGLGYCFSAALPPYLARAASTALTIMQSEPIRLKRLRSNAIQFHSNLSRAIGNSKLFLLTGDEISPVKHLRLLQPNNNENLIAIRSLISAAQAQGVALVDGKKLEQDRNSDTLSIRLTVSAAFSPEDIDLCSNILTRLMKKMP